MSFGPPHPALAFFPVLTFGPTLGFFAFFLKKYVKTRQRMFGMLSLLMGTFLLQQAFAITAASTPDRHVAEVNFLLASVFEMLALYTLILALEMFEKDTPFTPRQTVLAGLVSLAIGAMFSSPALDTSDLGRSYWVSFAEGDSVVFFQALFFGVAGVMLTVILVRSKKTAWSKRQKRLIKWLMAGIVFSQLLGSFTPVAIQGLTSSEEIHGALVVVGFLQNIGVLMVGFAFLQASSHPWLLQRQRNHVLIVFSPDGLSLFTKIFSADMDEQDVFLLSGGFSAISSMFQEATKSDKVVRGILFEDSELRVVQGEHFLCALLTEKATQASELALSNFTREFGNQFKSELANFHGNVQAFQSAEEIVERYFA
ncbi:MAG: hypothetical protein ACTSU5_21155 [Promethearchaeota archaeon]